MWGRRRKEKVKWKEHSSAFAIWTYALLILMATGAVYMALRDPRQFAFGSPRNTGASQSPAVSPKPSLTLTATGAHTFYWDQSGPFSLEDIHRQLADWRKTVPSPLVLITSDGAASFGDAARLIEEVRRQGIERIQIETRAPSASRP